MRCSVGKRSVVKPHEEGDMLFTPNALISPAVHVFAFQLSYLFRRAYSTLMA